MSMHVCVCVCSNSGSASTHTHKLHKLFIFAAQFSLDVQYLYQIYLAYFIFAYIFARVNSRAASYWQMHMMKKNM